MSKKGVTIYDIAQSLNVSPPTVSRALKDHPSISQQTRQMIKEKAMELGYQTNALASSLRTQKSYTLGVIVPRLNSKFMSSVLAGMEKSAVDAGYHLIIMQSFETEEKEKENVRLLFNHRVDGLMVSTTSSSDAPEYFAPFFEKNIPVVFFDRAPKKQKTYHCVTIDNQEAGYLITKHLLENNSRRILHITGNKNLQVYQHRLEGYKKALKEKNITYDRSLIWETSLDIPDGQRAAQKILKMKPLPDAVFVANDSCAITIMHYLQKNGIRIPEMIQITGFNNDPFSAFFKPSLTTIDYPGEKMGEATVNFMLQLINSKPIISVPRHLSLDFKFLIRGSTHNSHD
ncbi:LacI family DNA-binding transcriptional regulator [Thermophagus sp. OGC60D27]|uniref:LacI family DNA-binding transcriptional regulator n=1 Tax=Thermophagus sp. OGC60D27 TaxID=3458415 RepID=UPI00403804FE